MILLQHLTWVSVCFCPVQGHLPAGTQVLLAGSRIQDGRTATQADRPITAELPELIRGQHSYDSGWMLRDTVCLHDRLWTDWRHGTVDWLVSYFMFCTQSAMKVITGWNKINETIGKSLVHCSWCASVSEYLKLGGKKEVKWMERVEINRICGWSKPCKGTIWPPPDIEGTSYNSGFSTEGILISAVTVPLLLGTGK